MWSKGYRLVGSAWRGHGGNGMRGGFDEACRQERGGEAGADK